MESSQPKVDWARASGAGLEVAPTHGGRSLELSIPIGSGLPLPSTAPLPDDPSPTNAAGTEAFSLTTLIAGVREGNPRHLAELYRRYFATVVDSLRNEAGSEAEDIAQEAFLSLGRRLSGYQDRGSFEGWLKGVANNLWRTRRRSIARRREAGQVAGDVPAAGSGSTGPVTREDFWVRVLRDLSPALREVWILHQQGYQARDIAAKLGISAGAAATRLSRARDYLSGEVRRLSD